MRAEKEPKKKDTHKLKTIPDSSGALIACRPAGRDAKGQANSSPHPSPGSWREAKISAPQRPVVPR